MTVSAHNIKAYFGETELSVISAEFTLDESWSPYAQGSIEIALPEDTIVDALDPRNDISLNIELEEIFGVYKQLDTLTETFGGGTIADITTAWTGLPLSAISIRYYEQYNSYGFREAVRRSLTLVVRERVVNYVTKTLNMSLASGESLLQDYAHVSNTSYTVPTTNTRTAVGIVLGLIGATLQPGTATSTFDADAGIWEPGQTAWDFIQPIVEAGSLRLFCDEIGQWYLVEDDYNVPGSVNLSYLATVTNASDTISRDSEEWYDAVVIKYEYVDGSGNTIIAYDSASTVGFSKVLTLTYDTAYPGAGAAARILARAQGRGRVNDIRAISNYSATPGMSCSITMPNVDTQVGNVAAVSWSYPADEMTVKTRGLIEVPSTAWIFTASGIAWEDIAPGVSWNTYTA